ncbi:anaphase-promoting complex subunit 7 isoform X4 [Nilaparvata lugens]|uniref:anaphase-promoting complex subunit 7 isoform X2 n=1 Tax=Nilaparvata lugens TaxID=108931 RepID=UPI00193C9B3C|nr:anaphase-promoting complex subunit 7 isoform X2 [Nilaparvata lugens]XP_039290707.1 anaphase-promoting complex subunit 7 isoform X4 [Nilaparvata lugens]
MSAIFEQVKLLFEQELFSNVVSLVNMVSTVTDHNPQMMSMADKLQMLIYYGDSMFHLGQYRLADSVYRQAIQFRKSIIKSKSSTKINENSRDIVSDVDIKYQMHLCAVKLNQLDEAIRILQSIFAKQRTPKINMALAKRFQMLGMERPAITAYKEVLRECPMALEAAEALLALGVSAGEVESLVLDSSVTGMDWMTSWIKAHAHTQNKEYNQAINTFKQMEERSQIRGNHSLLVSLGEAYYFSGDNKTALVTLKRAHSLDKNQQRGLDILAALLASEKQISELEKLVPVSWTNEEHGPQAWIALSYLLYANNNLTRAAYLAQKACYLCPRNVEALVLKGKLLFDLKQYTEAISHFREAFKMAPHRFEPHKGLVDCYMATQRIREASTIASNTCKQLNNAPRALTLYASVLMKDPITICKAKLLLEKALSQDSNYLPAVYLLAEIYEELLNLEGAIKLLEKIVKSTPTSKLHQMLGDLLAKINEEAKAFDHYYSALSLDPNNQRAVEGLNRLDGAGGTGGANGGAGGGGRDTSYYNPMSDVDGSFVDHVPPSDQEDSSEISV